MKKKQLASAVFASLLIFAILFTMLPINAAAAGTGYITYSPYVNGSYYSGGDSEGCLSIGEKAELRIENVLLDGEPVADSAVTYQWEQLIGTMETGQYQEITGETASVFNVTFEQAVSYRCKINVGEALVYAEFHLKEDTLTVEPVSSPAGTMDEYGTYQIQNVPLGEKVTLNSGAKTTAPGGTLTYEWYRQPIGTGEMTEKLENTAGTYSFVKAAGSDLYYCNVSDGQVMKTVFFQVSSRNTLTVSPSINGFVPERFERGYMSVAKEGETVTMKVDVASAFGDVKYSWKQYVYNEDAQIYEQVQFGTGDSLTVVKQNVPEEVNDSQMYECYITDGNQNVNISFILFSIHPNQVTAAVDSADGVPSISVGNSLEALSNDLLAENLDRLSEGTNAKISLTADVQDQISAQEQAAAEKVISSDSTVAMGLDLNLYKQIGTAAKEKITETQKEIELSMDIPDGLKNTDEKVTRTYQVVRIHNGVAETLDVNYDAENGKLTFGTDRFSTYLIVYRDEANSQGTTAGTGTQDKNPEVKAPVTNDPSAMMAELVLLVVLCAALGCVVTYARTRKNPNRR